MKPRRQRMLAVSLIVVGVVLATLLVVKAFQENLLYFTFPTEVQAGEIPAGRKIRLGGLVVNDSMRREPGSLTLEFNVTDNESTVTVFYTGVLPDLFREGQGVIAIGYLQPDGSFLAEEVLAKHDENYMPPEVAKMLEERGHPVNQTATGQ